jgi:transcriptional regulator with AAA-type ATPase domain
VPPGLDSPVRQYLLDREYQGNVREFRQVVYRLHTRHAGTGPITAGDVPDDERSAYEENERRSAAPITSGR